MRQKKRERTISLVTAEGRNIKMFGDKIHRVTYTLVGFLPKNLQRKINNFTYKKYYKTWDLSDNQKVHDKRVNTAKEVNAQTKTLVEFGCASGENLRYIADNAYRKQNTHIKKLIGLDSSVEAVKDARHNMQKYSKVRIAVVEDLEKILGKDKIDTVLLSEVMYYLGSKENIRKTLQPIINKTHNDTEIILVHASDDALNLHSKTAHALKLKLLRENYYENRNSKYLISVYRKKTTNETDKT